MKYKVLKDFTDLQDEKRVYRKGDAYPHPDAKEPSDERIQSLLTKENKRGEVLIEKTNNLEELTVPELKAQLDEKGVGYDSKAKKAELVKLLENE